MSGNPRTNSLEKPNHRKVEVVSCPLDGPIHDSLMAVTGAVEEELARILAQARDKVGLLKEAVADSSLLSRKDAALLLNCSVAKLDRLTSAGELEATTFDSRPRYRLSELNRFIAVHSGKKCSPGGNHD